MTAEEHNALASAVDLPEGATAAVILGRIAAMRLLREAQSFEQVRRVLGLPDRASPLACALALCERLPAGSHGCAVMAMRRVEQEERVRWHQVETLCADALRAARDAAP